ncbi:MAG: hypothetical protein NT062_17475 [Proteobacteria bacterium]|nr:hypothetical protein [Pseudomonadota bacterium]
MTRFAAILVFSFAGLTLGHADSTKPKPAPASLEGAYTCQFELKNSSLPMPIAAQPCAISKLANGLQLAMLGGPKRLRGMIVANPKGFHLDGKFECPDGDCDEKTAGDFVRQPDGSFIGSVPTNGRTLQVIVSHAS